MFAQIISRWFGDGWFFSESKIKYFVSWSASPFYFWDKSACGSNLIIEDNGKVVQACSSFRSVRAKIALNRGIFEWDVIIEKACYI